MLNYWQVFPTSLLLSCIITWYISSKVFKKKHSTYELNRSAIKQHKEELKSLKTDIEDKQTAIQEMEAKTSDLKKVILNSETQFKSKEDELDRKKEQINRQKKELRFLEKQEKDLLALKNRDSEIQKSIDEGQKQYRQIVKEKEQSQKDLFSIKREYDLYNRLTDFIDFGFYEEPQYLYEVPDRYKVEVKQVRQQQKEMIKNQQAVKAPDDIEVSGSSKNGNAVLKGQIKIMLRAFNIECDYLMDKLTPGNFVRSMERMDKIALMLEKDSVSLFCEISIDYLKLKYQECKLLYEYKLKKQEEKEEQRMIKTQMREEQKALKEYTEAANQAEREERVFEKLLTKAHKKLEFARDEKKTLLEAEIELLKEQLQEAKEKGERALSMAQQTKRGYVYIISNVGSFGEGVYKIGLTRRLDPMERVTELGGASVPFKFDVHAMIYSKDAPALETTLHHKLKSKRVNVVNKRKEFFKVELDEIKKAVSEMDGLDEIEFKATIAASEYFDTLRLQGSVI